MKTVILLISIFAAVNGFSQQATLSVNGKKLNVNPTLFKEQRIVAERRLDFILIAFTYPSSSASGKYESISLQIKGSSIGKYPIGCCDAKNFNEPYESEITASWFDAYQREQRFDSRSYYEQSKGYITITTLGKDYKVTGSFNCVIAGNRIEGSFSDIAVSGF